MEFGYSTKRLPDFTSAEGFQKFDRFQHALK
jgi:hypothetical protein